MHRQEIAAIALGLAAVGLASNAFAQESPTSSPPATSPSTAVPDITTDAMPMPARTTAPPANATAPVGSTRTTSAEYQENVGAERREGYMPSRPLLVTGVSLLVVPYVAGVIVAAQSNLDEDKRNYVPIVGPWLDLGERPCAFGGGCSTSDNVGSAFLLASGVAQGVGLALTIASFAAPEKPNSRMTTGTTTVETSAKLVPVSFRGGGGLGAVGTF